MRQLQRNTRESLVRFLRAGFDHLGWNVEPFPFGNQYGLTVVGEDPFEEAKEVVPNTVAVTVASENDDRLQELGGPLYGADFQFRLDVYAEQPAIAVAIGSDIKSMVRDRQLPILDFAASTPVESGTLELTDAMIVRPAGDTRAVEFRQRWRVVNLFGRATFEDVDLLAGMEW